MREWILFSSDAAYIGGMETIIYFQKKRGLKEPLIEPIGMKTYLLVRVSLDVAREEWFGLGMEEPTAPVFGEGLGQQAFTVPGAENFPDTSGDICGGSVTIANINGWLHPFKNLQRRREEAARRQQECERRFAEVRDYHIRMEQWRQRLCRIEEAIQALVRKVNEMPQPEQPVWAVYEDCLKDFLATGCQSNQVGRECDRAKSEDIRGKHESANAVPENRLCNLWKQHIKLAEFRDYTKPFWIEQTLPEHMPPRLLILGRNLNVCPLLERLANRLKNIQWLLAEKDCTPDFLEYLEYFYEEYGLVISYRTFSDVNQLRRADLSCESEAVIFDFSGEVCVQTAGVARGSLWLDMYSSEEKQKKTECRNPGVLYFSLKKKWKQIQKVRNKPFFLDTVKENGYNTWESEGIL